MTEYSVHFAIVGSAKNVDGGTGTSVFVLSATRNTSEASNSGGCVGKRLELECVF